MAKKEQPGPVAKPPKCNRGRLLFYNLYATGVQPAKCLFIRLFTKCATGMQPACNHETHHCNRLHHPRWCANGCTPFGC